MIEQEITRLVNQSEKKGRFIIQELDDDVNVLEKSESLPNTVEKYFSKKTKHSSICNNNKIIHLLHNQSENPNLNSNFSTFIFEDNSKNWIDFDLVWTNFSKFHCDVSENNMEKIFNYTDVKLDDNENNENENNSSYFNDSLNINNNADIICNLLLSKENFNTNKNFINPLHDNLTNIQTTHDVSHSNIAESGLLSNITPTHSKNIHNEINFLNNNFNFNVNNNCTNQIMNNNINEKNSNLNNLAENTISSKSLGEKIHISNFNISKNSNNLNFMNEIKCEKIENSAEKLKLNLLQI